MKKINLAKGMALFVAASCALPDSTPEHGAGQLHAAAETATIEVEAPPINPELIKELGAVGITLAEAESVNQEGLELLLEQSATDCAASFTLIPTKISPRSTYYELSFTLASTIENMSGDTDSHPGMYSGEFVHGDTDVAEIAGTENNPLTELDTANGAQTAARLMARFTVAACSQLPED